MILLNMCFFECGVLLLVIYLWEFQDFRKLQQERRNHLQYPHRTSRHSYTELEADLVSTYIERIMPDFMFSSFDVKIDLILLYAAS